MAAAERRGHSANGFEKLTRAAFISGTDFNQDVEMEGNEAMVHFPPSTRSQFLFDCGCRPGEKPFINFQRFIGGGIDGNSWPTIKSSTARSAQRDIFVGNKSMARVHEGSEWGKKMIQR